MLGIIIGVGAVIAMVGIGNGARSRSRRASLPGPKCLQIFAGNISRGGVRSGFGGAGTLTVDDALAMTKRRFPAWPP